MPYNNGWPYTDVHQLNLDWIVQNMKEVLDKTDLIDQAVTDAQGYAESAENSAEIANGVSSSLENWYTTPELLEAVDENGVLDTAIINQALNEGKRIKGFNNYTLNSTLVIDHNYSDIEFLGSITSTVKAVIIKNCSYVNLKFKEIISSDDGIEILSDSLPVQFVSIHFDNLSSQKTAFLLNANYSGVQYIKINGKRIYFDENGIDMNVGINTAWIGEIQLYNLFAIASNTASPGYGVRCLGMGESQGFITGIECFGITLQNSNGLYLKNTFGMKMIASRFETSGSFPVIFNSAVRNCMFICRQLRYEDIDISGMTFPADGSNAGIIFSCNITKDFGGFPHIIATYSEVVQNGLKFEANRLSISVSGGDSLNYRQLEEVTWSYPHLLNVTGTVYLQLPKEYDANKINEVYVKVPAATEVHVINYNGANMLSLTTASVTGNGALFRIICVPGGFWGTDGWTREQVKTW